MTCDATRKRLLRGSTDLDRSKDPPTAAHLERCGDCRAFAERLNAARGALRDHRAREQPDGAFSARVLERIQAERARDPVDELGWAALRVLPAALALAALVTWSALQPRHGLTGLLLPRAGDELVAAFIVSGLEDPADTADEVSP